MSRESLVRHAVSLYFERTQGELQPGTLRVIADAVEIMPVNEEAIYRISFTEDRVHTITRINPLTRAIDEESVEVFFLFPAKHFVSGTAERRRAVDSIRKELDEQLAVLARQGNVLEHERLKRRTLQDLSLIEEIGYCNGIENYSRHFDHRQEGEPPHTLLSYFPSRPDAVSYTHLDAADE